MAKSQIYIKRRHLLHYLTRGTPTTRNNIEIFIKKQAEAFWK